MKGWISALVLIAALAADASCRELTGGVRAGAASSLLWGGWVEERRDELYGLGASSVTVRPYLSWRLGGWIDIPVRSFLSLRAEPGIGPVGGALLASDGYPLLVGVAGLGVVLPVLAAARVALPVGEIVIAAGIFAGCSFCPVEIQNDGVVRTEGTLARVLGSLGAAGGVGCAFPVGPGAVTADVRVLGSLLSIADPPLAASLNAVSFELSAGWEFGRRGGR